MCLPPPKINAPEAPKVEKVTRDRKERVDAAEDIKRRAAMGGIRSTILTGPAATNQNKTLTGQ